MSLINISNLTFCYDGSYDNIFENVSFQIDTNWKLGFTGRNGRGKTTFLNLLLGKHEYQGRIASSVHFDYFPFEIADKSELTINIIEGIYPEYMQWQLNRELNLLDVDADDLLYRPFETLSNGEQTKVMLATMFLRENNFLLIDEPTNHLDLEGRHIVSEYLKAKSGFILVSHDRAFLDNCIDHVLSINKTNIEIQRGNFSSWQRNKEYSDNYEFAENDRLKKDINRLEEAAKRTADWSDKVEAGKIGEHTFDRGRVGHMAAKMMKRSKVTERRQLKSIDDKQKLLKNIEKAEDLSIHPLAGVKGTNNIVTLDSIAISYANKNVFENVSMQIKSGDRIALQGKNGSGKSSIIKLIIGVDDEIAYSGSLIKASRLVVSYVPQDASFLKGSLNEYARQSGIDETLFMTILRKLDFSRLQFEKDMIDYSGGQKKKVLIAKSLCEQAHLYIWDEPLNYIDVLSRIQIEQLILKFKPTMLFVEHDSQFTENVATQIKVL